MLCVDKMSGISSDKIFGESEFAFGGGTCIDCDSCANIACSDDLLGRGVKTNKIVCDLGEKINKTFSIDKGDSL